MNVQACAACGARYNVERLASGSKFECRRCGAEVEVGMHVAPSCRFSPGLLVAGTLMLAGLLLYANPARGSGGAGWPWEILQGEDASWVTRATIVLWSLSGLWALVTAIGIAPRTRSVLTIAVAGVLVLVGCSGAAGQALAVDVALRPLHILLAMTALAAGLALLSRQSAEATARALAFGGGIALVWHYAFGFSASTPTLQALVEQMQAWIGGDLDSAIDPWRDLLPSWSLVLGGLVGILVGFGVGGRFTAWAGMACLLLAMILPGAAHLFEGGFGEIDGARLAEAGRAALVGSGLALWLLASYGLVDLACNRKAAA